jgi:hypothetical protein
MMTVIDLVARRSFINDWKRHDTLSSKVMGFGM